MANSDKDTIYVDIDDEITGIIDKVKGSKSKVVALVLPKRASVFQSIVNMKLLKRAADSSQKNVVLITAEAGLLPLAGAAGVHVAKTLTSKPEIPGAPEAFKDTDEAYDEDEGVETGDAAPLDKTQTIGALAGGAAAAEVGKDGVETVALDNEETPADAAADAKGKVKPTKAEKKAKKQASKDSDALKVPNFTRFRKLIILGVVVLVLLIVGFIFASVVLPKATITINTDATNVPVSLTLNLSTTATSANNGTSTLPAKLQTQQKTYTEQVSTTGQKNTGNKASGTIQMTAQECGQPQPASDVPAGTGVTSNGLTYLTQSDTTFTFNSIKNGCINFQAVSSTPILAQSGGSNYNNATSFSVAGRTDVTATDASTITGGTDNIVQTVNQNDINAAKAKISSSDSGINQALQTSLKSSGYYPIPSTYNAGTPVVTSSANVGDVANSVSVTEVITYTMFGVHESDLKGLVDNSVDGQIDTSKQAVLDEGLSSANFNVNSASNTSAQVAMTTTAVAGPQLNIASIKQSAAGKQSGDIKSQLQSNPDVTSVSVGLSPFWVTTVPTKTTRITVNIAKPTTTSSSGSSNGSNP